MAPRNNWWPLEWGCARAEGPRAWLQLHPPSPVTSTDYDTAADATETSSYFSAQGYLSRWGPCRGGQCPAGWQSWAWSGGWLCQLELTESLSWGLYPGHTVSVQNVNRRPQKPSRPAPSVPWTPHPAISHCPSLFPASREQEGAESTSEEGQLPQVVEELKDLQVAPGTRLAKFQLKVKGEGGGLEGQALPPASRGRVVTMARVSPGIPSLGHMEGMLPSGQWPCADYSPCGSRLPGTPPLLVQRRAAPGHFCTHSFSGQEDSAHTGGPLGRQRGCWPVLGLHQQCCGCRLLICSAAGSR